MLINHFLIANNAVQSSIIKEFSFGDFQNFASRNRGGSKLSNVAELQTRSFFSSFHLTGWT